MSLSVRRALAGKRILMTGVTGFVGKVWLAHLLHELPELGTIRVLLRPGRDGDARARLEELIGAGPPFWPLWERHGDGLGRALGPRLEALAGDVALPLCGLEPDALDRLAGQVDLVVHLAGITDFAPPLDQALAVNVDGPVHALELARRTGARLLHVSTAYVAGLRGGRIAERLEPDFAPLARRREAPFRAADELSALRRLPQRVRDEARDPQVTEALLTRLRAEARRSGGERDADGLARALDEARAEWEAERLAGLVAARAAHWGWPNAYTLSKSLGEARLAAHPATCAPQPGAPGAGTVPLVVVRPTIIEAALRFPFPGWKEGHSGAGPLAYATCEGLIKALPARPELRLDVIPVDLVARGLTLVAAAHLEGRAPAVVHLGTSDRNPITMRRLVELCALARRLQRGAEGEPLRDLLLRTESGVGSAARYAATDVPALRRLARGARALLERAADALPAALPPALAERARAAASGAERAELRLAILEQIVERFRPFIAEVDCVFETGAIAALDQALDPGEREAFGCDPASFDWRAYWLDVLVPGMRRWVFPRFEGRRAERPPVRPLRLESPATGLPARSGRPLEVP